MITHLNAAECTELVGVALVPPTAGNSWLVFELQELNQAVCTGASALQFRAFPVTLQCEAHRLQVKVKTLVISEFSHRSRSLTCHESEWIVHEPERLPRSKPYAVRDRAKPEPGTPRRTVLCA